MRATFICLSLLLAAAVAEAQFAPQAGTTGSTAVAKSSSLFKSWATGCHLQRGLQRIGNAGSGYASLGDSVAALGAPNNDVVSLGDSGVAVLTFARPVINGPGPDFAVFENGFINGANAEEAFLELAFVEVSSDGINFTRFTATSNTQDTAQLSSVNMPSYTNARHLNNLAGKYIGGWGTPFDLEELKATPGLDVDAITHIRIVDAIGSIGAEGSADANGRKVNDPFPSPFASSGFDLDAVGVINAQPAGIGSNAGLAGISIFPNPAGDRVVVTHPDKDATITLFDARGQMLEKVKKGNGRTEISLQQLPAGTYFIAVQGVNGTICSAFSHN